ncbi:hypothetical protein MUK42_29640 [Musa troglodytarum]|uniref:Uncharacterized protein n=1 Tax=Musa troglodytarum TaxID=320322 RepID=A0A9E7JX90_9LILI|nr:hypothetical protein MUK42_29640 [Musa troglodytarum]
MASSNSSSVLTYNINHCHHKLTLSPTFAFPIVNGIDKSSVVPVLNHIVRPIMDLYFNGISTVLDEKYNAPLPMPDHC